jgi:hypothetical protein
LEIFEGFYQQSGCKWYKKVSYSQFALSNQRDWGTKGSHSQFAINDFITTTKNPLSKYQMLLCLTHA